MFDCHTEEIIFNMLINFQDSIYLDWRRKMINVLSDGKNTITRRHTGLVTRIARCEELNVLRVWCAPHQIRIAVKLDAESISYGFYIKEVYFCPSTCGLRTT